MAYTPSITEEFSQNSPKISPLKHSSVEDVSPKLSLPTKHSIEKEATPNYHSREFSFSSCIPPSNWQKFIAELVGTFFLIFAGCGASLISITQPYTPVPVVWGLVLMASIYAVGHISGAHFNPAVTLAFAAGRKFSWKLVPMYILSQLLGATLASLTLRVLYNELTNVQLQVTVTQYQNSTTSDLEAVTWEFIITFILMFVVLAVATDDRASQNIAGVAIGGTLLFIAIIAGPITGASMNPARSIGPAVVMGLHKNLWVYIVAPILGAMFATLVYSILREPKPEKPESTKSMYNDLYVHHSV